MVKAKNMKYKILVVDDEKDIVDILKYNLVKENEFDVLTASNGKDAIEIVESEKPDLILLDIMMPEINGFDVCKRLKTSHSTMNIPIIFLTSYYNDKILNQAMEAEPYAYLIKPCKNEELKVAINTALHKHQFFFKNKNLINSQNNKYIQIEQNIKFDLINTELYVDEKIVKLTKTEKKLFEILTSQAGKIVSFDTIFNFIWREDVYDLSKLRSLIYRLKNKLKFNPFENLYEEGYKIKIVKIDENS